VGQSLGGGAVPLCGQGGLGLCPRLGCHGLAPPEWRTGHTLHLLTCLCLVSAADLVNVLACWYLYECTAGRLAYFAHSCHLSEIITLLHILLFWPEKGMLHLHASCGERVATALCDAAAEARSGGLHTAAQVAETPQAGPHQALTPSPGTPCPLTQTITSCSPHNFNQASHNAACQSDAMFSHCTCSAIALHFTLELQGTACQSIGFVFVKHLLCC